MVNKTEFIKLMSMIQKNSYRELGDFVSTDEKEEEFLIGLDTFYNLSKYHYSREKYELDYAFKSAAKKVKVLHKQMEFKLNSLSYIDPENEICALDKKMNSHIISEINKTSKRFRRLFLLYRAVDFMATVFLILGVTSVVERLEARFLGLDLLIIILATCLKVFLDKNILDPYMTKKGWSLYRKGLNRSFAFYFASLAVIHKLEGADKSMMPKECNLKSTVRSSIDLILTAIN